VGNALSWFYLADKWAAGEGVRPEERWVNNLAREEAGMPYLEGENKLPRGSTLSTDLWCGTEYLMFAHCPEHFQ